MTEGMRALSIRQPYAELILRGEKTIEYRSRPTRIIGERFYIYAARGFTAEAQRHRASLNHGWIDPRTLPRGVIVGTAVIERCQPAVNHPHPLPRGGGLAPTANSE